MLAVRFAIVIGKTFVMGEGLSLFSEEQDELSFSMVIFYILLIPLIEEFLFRGFLDITKNKISIYFIGAAAIPGAFFLIEIPDMQFPVLFIVMLFIYAYLRIKSFQKGTNAFIEKHYHILVIASVIIFAGMHITNYQEYSLTTFVALLPRVISGFYLAYVVTKYNIWYAWLMHAINNTLPFIAMIVLG